MAKYRKKPVVINAVKWTGSNVKEMIAFVSDKIKDVSEIGADKSITIHTLEGDMKADVGDYVIKGIKGEFYPCKSDIFEATYESVGDAYDRVEIPSRPKTLSPSEALFGFIGWLTSGKEKIILSADSEPHRVLELLDKWLKANKLAEPRNGWSDILVQPKMED